MIPHKQYIFDVFEAGKPTRAGYIHSAMHCMHIRNLINDRANCNNHFFVVFGYPQTANIEINKIIGKVTAAFFEDSILRVRIKYLETLMAANTVGQIATTIFNNNIKVDLCADGIITILNDKKMIEYDMYDLKGLTVNYI